MARELVCSQKRGWISEGHTCERGGGACATASARCGKKLSLAVGGGGEERQRVPDSVPFLRARVAVQAESTGRVHWERSEREHRAPCRRLALGPLRASAAALFAPQSSSSSRQFLPAPIFSPTAVPRMTSKISD